jgi:hypothetical protein
MVWDTRTTVLTSSLCFLGLVAHVEIVVNLAILWSAPVRWPLRCGRDVMSTRLWRTIVAFALGFLLAGQFMYSLTISKLNDAIDNHNILLRSILGISESEEEGDEIQMVLDW